LRQILQSQDDGTETRVSKGVTRLEDLAKMAGVSISTASRALNDSPAVNMRTKQTIWKLAREMDYPFRRYMPAGPIGAEATIAIVTPRPQGRDSGMSDPFFLELLAGVGEAASERGCDILLSHISPATYEDLSVAMTTSRAEGVIFLGQSSLHAAFNRLSETEGRFVVWGAQLPDQNYCSIGSDNPMGGRRATLHLARLGRKRIVFLGDTEAPEAMQRHRGYLDALEQQKLGVDPGPDRPRPLRGRVRRGRRRLPDPSRREVRRRRRRLRPDRAGGHPRAEARRPVGAGRRLGGRVRQRALRALFQPGAQHDLAGHRQGRAADGVQAAGRRRSGQPVGADADGSDHSRELRGVIAISGTPLSKREGGARRRIVAGG
jgi:transcriptional regulator with XRE-family HTH domain